MASKAVVTKKTVAAKTKTAEPKWGGMASSTVKTKTGRDWDEWVKTLDKAKAERLTHKEIAELLSEKYEVSPWWSQMVTVGYEQAKGRREVHQTISGYTAGVSRTINVHQDELWKALGTATGRKRWLKGAYEVSSSTPNKSVRIKWSDGSRVEMMLLAKGDAKSSVSVQHMKLKDAQAVAKWKKFWADALTNMKEILEA